MELYYRSRDNSRNMIFNLLQGKNEKIRETVITDKNLHITLYNIDFLLLEGHKVVVIVFRRH